MAHALSIVGEAGLGGFEYNSATFALSGDLYRSRKGRWTLSEQPSFTPEEFREYISYAAIAGYLDAGEDTVKIASGFYSVEAIQVRLTLEGWDQIEMYDRPMLHRWASNIKENVPTVFLSVAAAVLSSWLVFKIGAPK
jgi:hypothetical protein